jgi:hypothetical protein
MNVIEGRLDGEIKLRKEIEYLMGKPLTKFCRFDPWQFLWAVEVVKYEEGRN